MAVGVGQGFRMRRLGRAARERAIGEILGRWRSSGEGKAAFCRREGIASVRLTSWLGKFGEGRRAAREPRGRFVEVHATALGRATCFEVALPGEVTLRVLPGFDAAELSRLLQVLRATC